MNKLDDLEKIIRKGLLDSEYNMLKEKALHNANVVVSKNGLVRELSAKDVLLRRFGEVKPTRP